MAAPSSFSDRAYEPITTAATTTVEAVPSAGAPAAAGGEAQPHIIGSAYVAEPIHGKAVVAPPKRELAFTVGNDSRPLLVRPHNPQKAAAQQQRHKELHEKLTTGHPHAAINLSKGYIEENGRIIAYLNENPDSQTAKDLDELRHLYCEMLGQKFSDLNWGHYLEHDRAALNDPLPYQGRKTNDTLKKLKFDPNGLPDVEKAKEFQIAKKFRQAIVDVLEKQATDVGNEISLNAQSRQKEIVRVKEKFEHLDELVMGFQATFPPPDLTPDPQSKKDTRVELLEEYKEKAKTFLDEAVQKNQNIVRQKFEAFDKRNSPDYKEAADRLASEMALTACQSRADYDFGCTVFKCEACQTTPELFILRVAGLLSKGNKAAADKLIDEQFPIAFRGLSHDEDKQAIRNAVSNLPKQIETELAQVKPQKDIAQYHRDVDKQEIIDKQKELTTKIDAFNKEAKPIPLEFRLSSPINAIQRTQADAEYKPVVADIDAEVKRAEEKLKAAEERIAALSEEKRKEARPFVNRLKRLIEAQKEIRNYLVKKYEWQILPKHAAADLHKIRI